MRSGRAQAVPLAALVGVVAALVMLRIARRAPAPSGAGSMHVASATIDGGDAMIARAAKGEGEEAGAPRATHEDARRTHRARGVKGPARAKVAWTAAIGAPIEAQVVASPDESALYVASLDGALTALDAKSGEKKWSVALGDRAYLGPCVADDGTIYAGSDAKRFVAITPSGAIAWKLEVDGEADTACAIASDGRIVFAAGPHVYAVRRGGDVAWRFDARKKVFTAPAIGDDGTIAFGSQDHHAYALDGKANGALAWSVDLGADVDGGAAITDDGDVIVGTDAGEIVRLHAGAIAWRAPVGGFVRGPLSIARDGAVLAGVYGPTPRVVRVAPDGKLVASLVVPGTGAREFGVHGGPLEDARGALYFGSQDDAVRAIGPEGEWAWKYETRGDVDAPLTLLSSGALVVAGDDGNVILFAP